MTTNNLTNKELLIRIDERQQRIMKDIQEIKDDLLEKVTDDSDYQDMKHKVDALWDWRNRVIGYSVGAGAATSLTFEIVKYLFDL